MDTNYSRWIHNDVAAEADTIDEERRRFRLPRPAGSVVARGLMATAVVVGLGGIIYSVQTPEASTTQQQSPLETTIADQTDAPGAAAIEESTIDDATPEESTDESTEDATDESTDELTDESMDAPGFIPARPAHWRRTEVRDGPPSGIRMAIRRARDARPPGQHLERRPLLGPPDERLEWDRE